MFEVVIGLEVHVQLNTKSKLFCSCATSFGEEANSNTYPTCLALPGGLPVLNKEAVHKAIMLGTALKSQINQVSVFDRKNYFYPDLPTGYQISQLSTPVVGLGELTIDFPNGSQKTIGVTRAHLENDAGKNIHSGNHSQVDLNRAGTPLLEIVSEPDMRTPEDAYEYLVNLKNILKYIEISDCNMEEGSLRCDANISIRPEGQEELGTKVEIKNMNSFNAVKKAIEYEINRQIKLTQKGEKIIQETRLYDADKNQTFSMRTKEEAHDYRYFPDPDLVPIVTSGEFINDVRKTLPELPKTRRTRFISEYKIPEYDANVLTSEKDLADYYESAVKSFPKDPKKISNWIMSEVMFVLNEKKLSPKNFKVKPSDIGELFKLQDNGTISGKIAKEIFSKMVETGEDPKVIIDKNGLKQISDTGELEKIIDDIIAKNPGTAEQYRSGKTQTIGFFVGQVMKATKGQANPGLVNELLKKKLQ